MPFALRHQSLKSLAHLVHDLLLHRTFGERIAGVPTIQVREFTITMPLAPCDGCAASPSDLRRLETG